MKDKTAKKLKQKRRAERQAARDEEIQKIVDSVNIRKNQRGVNKKYSNEHIYSVYKRLQNEISREAVMDCLIITMYCLNRDHGMGQERLMRYTNRMQRIIYNVGNDIRSIDKLSEELKYEIDIDVESFFDGYEPFDGVKQNSDYKIKIVCLMERIPTWLTACIYVLYFDYGFKHKRLNTLIENIKTELIPAVENGKILEYADKIRQKCKIDIKMDGVITVIKPEQKRIKRRTDHA